jgi:hypothetical protein
MRKTAMPVQGHRSAWALSTRVLRSSEKRNGSPKGRPMPVSVASQSEFRNWGLLTLDSQARTAGRVGQVSALMPL